MKTSNSNSVASPTKYEFVKFSETPKVPQIPSPRPTRTSTLRENRSPIIMPTANFATKTKSLKKTSTTAVRHDIFEAKKKEEELRIKNEQNEHNEEKIRNEVVEMKKKREEERAKQDKINKKNHHRIIKTQLSVIEKEKERTRQLRKEVFDDVNRHDKEERTAGMNYNRNPDGHTRPNYQPISIYDNQIENLSSTSYSIKTVPRKHASPNPQKYPAALPRTNKAENTIRENHGQLNHQKRSGKAYLTAVGSGFMHDMFTYKNELQVRLFGKKDTTAHQISNMLEETAYSAQGDRLLRHNVEPTDPSCHPSILRTGIPGTGDFITNETDVYSSCEGHILAINARTEWQQTINDEIKRQAKFDHVVCQKMLAKSRRLQRRAETLADNGASIWVSTGLKDIGSQVKQKAKGLKGYVRNLEGQHALIQQSIDSHFHLMANEDDMNQDSSPNEDDGVRHADGIEDNFNNVNASNTDKKSRMSFREATAQFENIRRERFTLINTLDYLLGQRQTADDQLAEALRAFKTIKSEHNTSTNRGEKIYRSKEHKTRVEFLEKLKEEVEKDIGKASSEITKFMKGTKDKLDSLEHVLHQHRNSIESTLKKSLKLLASAMVKGQGQGQDVIAPDCDVVASNVTVTSDISSVARVSTSVDPPRQPKDEPQTRHTNKAEDKTFLVHDRIKRTHRERKSPKIHSKIHSKIPVLYAKISMADTKNELDVDTADSDGALVRKKWKFDNTKHLDYIGTYNIEGKSNNRASYQQALLMPVISCTELRQNTFELHGKTNKKVVSQTNVYVPHLNEDTSPSYKTIKNETKNVDVSLSDESLATCVSFLSNGISCAKQTRNVEHHVNTMSEQSSLKMDDTLTSENVHEYDGYRVKKMDASSPLGHTKKDVHIDDILQKTPETEHDRLLISPVVENPQVKPKASFKVIKTHSSGQTRAHQSPVKTKKASPLRKVRQENCNLPEELLLGKTEQHKHKQSQEVINVSLENPRPKKNGSVSPRKEQTGISPNKKVTAMQQTKELDREKSGISPKHKLTKKEYTKELGQDKGNPSLEKKAGRTNGPEEPIQGAAIISPVKIMTTLDEQGQELLKNPKTINQREWYEMNGQTEFAHKSKPPKPKPRTSLTPTGSNGSKSSQHESCCTSQTVVPEKEHVVKPKKRKLQEETQEKPLKNPLVKNLENKREKQDTFESIIYSGDFKKLQGEVTAEHNHGNSKEQTDKHTDVYAFIASSSLKSKMNRESIPTTFHAVSSLNMHSIQDKSPVKNAYKLSAITSKQEGSIKLTGSYTRAMATDATPFNDSQETPLKTSANTSFDPRGLHRTNHYVSTLDKRIGQGISTLPLYNRRYEPGVENNNDNKTGDIESIIKKYIGSYTPTKAMDYYTNPVFTPMRNISNYNNNPLPKNREDSTTSFSVLSDAGLKPMDVISSLKQYAGSNMALYDTESESETSHILNSFRRNVTLCENLNNSEIGHSNRSTAFGEDIQDDESSISQLSNCPQKTPVFIVPKVQLLEQDKHIYDNSTQSNRGVYNHLPVHVIPSSISIANPTSNSLAYTDTSTLAQVKCIEDINSKYDCPDNNYNIPNLIQCPGNKRLVSLNTQNRQLRNPTSFQDRPLQSLQQDCPSRRPKVCAVKPHDPSNDFDHTEEKYIQTQGQAGVADFREARDHEAHIQIEHRVHVQNHGGIQNVRSEANKSTLSPNRSRNANGHRKSNQNLTQQKQKQNNQTTYHHQQHPTEKYTAEHSQHSSDKTEVNHNLGHLRRNVDFGDESLSKYAQDNKTRRKYNQDIPNLILPEGTEQTEMRCLGMAADGFESERPSDEAYVCHKSCSGKIRYLYETPTHGGLDDQELSFAVDIPKPGWQIALMANEVAEIPQPGWQLALLTNEAAEIGEVPDYKIKFETPKKVRFNEYVSCKQVH